MALTVLITKSVPLLRDRMQKKQDKAHFNAIFHAFPHLLPEVDAPISKGISKYRSCDSKGKGSMFRFFPRLPPEIRLAIWRLSLAPRKVELHIAFNLIWTGHAIYQPESCDEIYPAIWHVSRESRAEAMKIYSIGFTYYPRGSPREGGVVYFSPRADNFKVHISYWNKPHLEEGSCIEACTEKLASFCPGLNIRQILDAQDKGGEIWFDKDYGLPPTMESESFYDPIPVATSFSDTSFASLLPRTTFLGSTAPSDFQSMSGNRMFQSPSTVNWGSRPSYTDLIDAQYSSRGSLL